jgi:excisionase family DNA binding protein
MTDHLLTARAVASQLAVSPETVLRWVRRGELPAIRLPSGALRFRSEELAAWLEERATPRRGVLATTTSAARRAPYPLPSDPLATTDDEE